MRTKPRKLQFEQVEARQMMARGWWDYLPPSGGTQTMSLDRVSIWKP